MDTAAISETILNPELEARIQAIGRELLTAPSDVSVFRAGFLSQKLMDLSIKMPRFKIQAFRFVDLMPNLEEPNQVLRHFREYFLGVEAGLPLWLRRFGLWITALPVISTLFAVWVRRSVLQMAKLFITGTKAQEASPRLEALWKDNSSFTVDILGEAVLSEAEAEVYLKKYLDLICGLSESVKAWASRDILEQGVINGAAMAIPRCNVSVKCSSLYSMMDNWNFQSSVEGIKNRLRLILREAKLRHVFVNLDMESYDSKEILFQVAEDIFLEEEFRDYPHFGIVIQAYLYSASQDIERVVSWCEKRQSQLTVRLVKGAYWDSEVILSAQRGWPVPVFTEKRATDANYELCTAQLLRAYPKVNLAVGSHNARSVATTIALAEKFQIPPRAFEFQMLYGMADSLRAGVQRMGFRVRQYAPVGELIPGMAYLVRRLLENTANEGFVRTRFVDRGQVPLLLRSPHQTTSPKMTQMRNMR